MEWVGLIAGGGVGILSVVALIIAIRFARARDDRADQAYAARDAALAKAAEQTDLAAGEKRNRELADANVATLRQALASSEAEVHKANASVDALEESFHALLQATSSSPAPGTVAAIQTAAAVAADRLRATLDHLRTQAQTVPAAAVPAPARDPGSGEDPGLPHAPGSGPDPVPG